MDALLWWPFNGMAAWLVGLGLDSQQTPLSIKVLFTNFYLFNSHSHHHRSPSIDRLIAWSLVWPKYYNLPPPPPLQWLGSQPASRSPPGQRFIDFYSIWMHPNRWLLGYSLYFGGSRRRLSYIQMETPVLRSRLISRTLGGSVGLCHLRA